MLYEEELTSTPGAEAVTGSLRGASEETMEILAEVEAIFSSDLDRRDPVYARLFRQIAVTLASTGSVSLAQLVEVVRDGYRAGAVYETYLTNYASSCRAVLKYVGTAARLLLPQQEGLDEAPSIRSSVGWSCSLWNSSLDSDGCSRTLVLAYPSTTSSPDTLQRRSGVCSG
jgi:hypothetical protein